MQTLRLNTGSLDGLASKLLGAIFRCWVDDWRKGRDWSSIDLQVIDGGIGIYFELEACLYLRRRGDFSILPSTGADSRDLIINPKNGKLKAQEPFIIIEMEINRYWLPIWWSELYMHLADCIRHELEHITQDGELIGNYRQGKPNQDDSQLRELIHLGILDTYHYLLLPKEVDAMLQGLRFKAKKSRENFRNIIDKYLDTQSYLNSTTRAEILRVWSDRAKKIGGIPDF